jgi:RNA polymerase sigma-70 factor, ECF subfamily
MSIPSSVAPRSGPAHSSSTMVHDTPRGFELHEALIKSIYDNHGQMLMAYALRLTGNRSTAEDVVQETVLRTWQHTEVLTNGKGSVRAWLMTVLRNIVIDSVRAKACRPGEVRELPTVHPVEADHAENVVRSISVLEAMDDLSADHRAVLIHIYYRSQTVAEAADALGVPPGTVKSRCYYALTALRRILGDSFVEDRQPTR